MHALQPYFVSPPTDTPAESWTFLTDALGSPHTCLHGSLILSDPAGPAQAPHPRPPFLRNALGGDRKQPCAEFPCFANANTCLFSDTDVLVFACSFACMYQIVHLTVYYLPNLFSWMSQLRPYKSLEAVFLLRS